MYDLIHTGREFADSEIHNSTVDSTVTFWRPEVLIGEPAAFQLALTLPPTISIASLPIASLSLYISGSDDAPSVIVNHSSSGSPSKPSSIRFVDIKDTRLGATRELEANLRWDAGTTVVLAGRMTSDLPKVMKAGPRRTSLRSVMLTAGLVDHESSPYTPGS